MNLLTSALFTDINRRLGDSLRASGATLHVEQDEPAFLGGTFRIVLLREPVG